MFVLENSKQGSEFEEYASRFYQHSCKSHLLVAWRDLMFATAVMQQTCGLDRNGLIDCRKKSLVDWIPTAISPFCLFGDGSLLGDQNV